jgi:thioredoxin-dependent peroxiredoxin
MDATYKVAAVIEEGQPAPDFELEADSGGTVRLSDLRGKTVVLYFFPRDDTPGCTTQACGVRDSYDDLRKRGAEVFGISIDTTAAHGKFKSKYKLPFTLLADPERSLGEAYGVTRAGKETYARSTVIVDGDGTVKKILRNVKPELHADQVLAAL